MDAAAKLIMGCGYLGRRVAMRWLAQGRRVFATTRSQSKAEELSELGVEPIICDVLERASLTALPRVGVVVYCIGHDRSTGRPMHETYVRGLKNVIGTLPFPLRMIYVGSTSVYGQCQGEEVDETAATEPLDQSGQVMHDAETLVRYGIPSELVLRFAGMYGPGRLLRQQTIERGEPIVGDPERWLNLIHIEDGVAAVLAAEEHGRPGRTYNVADDQPVRRREFYTVLAHLIEAPAPTFVLPAPGSPVPSHERSNRRIVNRLLHEELRVQLHYPSYESGLPASVVLA